MVEPAAGAEMRMWAETEPDAGCYIPLPPTPKQLERSISIWREAAKCLEARPRETESDDDA